MSTRFPQQLYFYALLHSRDLVHWARKAVDRNTAGVVGARRVIGDREISHPERFCRQGHFLDGVPPSE
jgi:hypothetical protein